MRTTRWAALLAAAMVAIGPGIASGAAPEPDRIPSTAEVRPGPDILYWPLAEAPQLENVGGWKAEPIMVSGASAYRRGEFLYQDYLYDDVGTYPDGQRYARNAADFVELRVRLLPDATAIRITYNSMVDRDVPATTIAFGTSETAHPMPHGAGTKAPGEVFVTAHGSTGDIVRAATGQRLPVDPAVTTDLARRQTEVRIPYRAFDPRGRVVRMAAGTGVWDQAEDQYLPRPVRTGVSDTSSGATRPGIGGSAFYNAAFRYHESGDMYTAQETAGLDAGDISPFFAPVDFTKLGRKVDDDLTGVSASATSPSGPKTQGWIARVLVSHFELGQGRQTAVGCDLPCESKPDYPGRLLPYHLYIPAKPMPPEGYGLTLNLHNCALNYTSLQHQEFGERERPSLILSPQGRGSCNWYWGAAGAESFEAWADVAARYRLDRGYTAVAGGSGGGYGTYKFLSQFPDLFAAAVPIVGCPSAAAFWPGAPASNHGGEASIIEHLVPSWRHVAVMSLNGRTDEICVNSAQERIRLALDAAEYPYVWRDYAFDHFLDGFLDYREQAAFMGSRRVDPNPAHVTYVFNEGMHQPQWGMSNDHAYWLSGLRLADESGPAPRGTIDVYSHGFGVGDPPVSQPQVGTGTNAADCATPCLPLLPHYSLTRTAGEPPANPIADVLDIRATNIAAVTIDVARARVSCDVTLNITSDTPVQVTLLGCKLS